MKGKKKVILSVLGILMLVLVTVGVTFAVFTYTKLGTTENTVTTGTLKFLYTENTGIGAGINIENAFPVSDTVGKSYDTDKYVFDFSVEATNSGNEEIPYEVTLRKKSTSTLSESNIKVYLTDMTGDSDTQIVAPTLYSDLTETTIDVGEETEKTIYNGTVLGGELTYLKDFRLRMWIDESSNQDDINGKTFVALVNVYANANLINNTTYKEALLNGADPVLESTTTLAKGDTEVIRISNTENKTKLVPVIIGDDGSVVKADITKRWYSYADKEWANAIILKDETVEYENGASIPESNIESYFVWIPRYKYKIFDEGNYTGLTSFTDKTQIIEIEFENKNMEPSNGTTKDSWLTHPAFTSFDSNGIWVGKFETGYDGATSTSAAQVNTVNTSKIVIKPNVYSWRNMTIGNMFKNSFDYLRDLDSHTMKNTEWGAVAYLGHSAYGSQAGVRINNNKAYITGYSATVEPTLGHNGGTSIDGNRNESTSLGVDGTYTVNYLNPNSVVSSTTGNYTGLYDMSGGCWNYVMGYTTGATTNSSGITSLYSNFFNDIAYAKYWDKYTSTTETNYNNRILGDATGEMGPFGNEKDPDGSARYKSSWYKDYAYFVDSSNPWFYRGGAWNSGTNAGSFAFSSRNGGVGTNFGYRIVLTPNN